MLQICSAGTISFNEDQCDVAKISTLATKLNKYFISSIIGDMKLCPGYSSVTFRDCTGPGDASTRNYAKSQISDIYDKSLPTVTFCIIVTWFQLRTDCSTCTRDVSSTSILHSKLTLPAYE